MDHATTSADGHGTWRARRVDERQPRRRRLLLGVLLTTIAAVLLTAFCVALFWPMLHPKSHLTFLAADDYHTLGVPPLGFVEETWGSVQELEPVLYHSGSRVEPLRLEGIVSPARMERLPSELQAGLTARSDVLIIFVAAHGISRRGEPWLLCEDIDTAHLGRGLYPARQLVRELTETDARTKLLILDLGGIDYDPRFGIIVNEFPRLIRTLVEDPDVADSSLWVLNSNSVGQRSHVSTVLRRSVFSHFVMQGLQGQADLDEDTVVDLGELHKFVSTHVSAWVDQYSAGNEAQVPQLIRGSGAIAKDVPALISVSRFTSEQTDESQSGPGDEPNSGTGAPTESAASASYPDLFCLSRPTGRTSLPGGVFPISTTALMSAVASPQAVDQDGESDDGTPGETSAANGGERAEGNGENGSGGNESVVGSEPDGEQDEQFVTSTTTIDLLGDVWRLRDTLESRRSGVASPIDVDAQLWRVMIARAMRIEHLVRAGRGREAEREAAGLNRTLLSLSDSPGDRASVARIPDDLGRQIASQLHAFAEPIKSPRSLAVSELFVPEKQDGSDEGQAKEVERLVYFFHDGNREEFDDWVGQLGDDRKDLFELRLAAELAGRKDLEWSLVQLALETRWRGERVAAADAGSIPWIRSRVEEADRLRTGGERTLLDGLGDSARRAEESLRQALRLYERASNELGVVRQARQLSNDLVFRAPYYVRLHNIIRRADAIVRPEFEELQDLLRSLQAIIDLLDENDVEQIPRLQSLTEHCQRLRASIEADFSVSRAILLGERPEENGVAWRIGVLLDQPLADGEIRAELLRAADRAEAAFATGFRPPKMGNGQRRPGRVQSLDWESLRQQAELELLLARLAASRLPAGRSSCDLLQQAYEEIQAAWRASGASPWSGIREFGGRLEQFYRELPDQIDDAVQQCEAPAADSEKNLRSLQAAQRALRLLDVRDAASLQAKVQPLLGEAHRYALLAWLRQRFLAALAFAPVGEASYLRTAAAAYRRQAVQIPNQTAIVAATGPVLQLELPDAARLTNNPEGEVSLQLKNVSSSDVRVWVVLQYDADCLEIATQPDRIIYHEPASRAASQQQWKPDPHPLPSFTIPVDAAKTASIRLRSIGKLPSDSRLIVKAVVAPAHEPPPDIFFVDQRGQKIADMTRGAVSDPGFALRGAIEIAVPAPESIRLRIDGTAGSWSRSTDGAVLHCFPNRTTGYQLSLVNNTERARTVDVRLLLPRHGQTIQMPPGALDPGDAKAFLAQLEPATEVARIPAVELPVGEDPVPIPFPEVAPSEDSDEPVEPGGKQPDADRAGAGAVVPSQVIDSLFLVITDLQSQRLMAKRLIIAPQRPRRYTRAVAGYHLQDERLVLRVSARDPARIPPGGVEVEAHFAEPLPPGTQAKLKGQLTAPDFETELYADVPRSDARVLSLDVDRYPRAFVFRVPCNTHAERISEETTMQEIRILQPRSRDVFRAPCDSIMAALQIDAPVGSFQNGDDLIEVGIDADLDGEFRGESTVRLLSDRQLSVIVVGFSEDGTMVFDTRVGDHQVPLSTAGLENVNVNVLARLQTGAAAVWSDPVKILLDAAPPKITEVTLIPDRTVVVGDPLTVAIGATDGSGSGVEKAEAALDTAGTGEFAEDPAPVEATRGTGSQWMAELDTGSLSPGSYTLLARATDAVGNTSDYTSIQGVRIITAEMAEQLEGAAVNRVLGTVQFGKDPAPGMEMTLTSVDEEGPTIGPVVADEQGSFVFAEVPAGTFVLTAKGKIKNGGRSIVVPRGQDFFEVTVAPPPASAVRLGTVQVR